LNIEGLNEGKVEEHLETIDKPIRRNFPLRRVVLAIIKTIVAVPILLITLYAILIGWEMNHWSKANIELPDGSGKVVFLTKLNHLIPAEYDRRILIKTKGFPNTILFYENDGCGGQPVDVYWYPARSKAGPYLLFDDPYGGDILDLSYGNYVDWNQEAPSYLSRTAGRYLGSVEYGGPGSSFKALAPAQRAKKVYPQ